MPYLIWDFDGTLGFRDGGWSGAMHDVLKANHLAGGITAAHIRAHILSGFRWHDTARQYPPFLSADLWWEELTGLFTRAYTAVCNLPEAHASALARQVRTQYLRPDAWHLYDDSHHALRHLTAAGYTHALLSNHVPELPQLLRHLGIDHCFKHVINSADTGYEKPHPQAYAHILALLPPAADVTMIGDNPVADYSGAKAAGINAILVRRPTPGISPYFADLTALAHSLTSTVTL